MNLAYVAGIIDGEGCINFSKCRTSIFPRVLVTNTNMDLLLALKEQFGGDINALSLRKFNWKQGYSWRISWSAAVEFLDKISKYLIIKDKQAHTVFAWNAIRPTRGYQWDNETLNLLTDRMKWLNRKGNIITDDPVNFYLPLTKGEQP